MNGTAIEVKDLHKAFGETKAVDGVSFSVEKGEIFSLLGRGFLLSGNPQTLEQSW